MFLAVFIMCFAFPLFCWYPLAGFFTAFAAFAVLLWKSINSVVSERKGLDFGQEWDYDTASKEYYRKQHENDKSHDAKMKRAAARLAAKHRPRVLSKIASGQQTVWVFLGLYTEDDTFRRYFTQYLDCGKLNYVLPFFLEFRVKEFVR